MSRARESLSSPASICPSCFLHLLLLPLLCRFLFILLGPSGRAKSYNEIGRAIATLMVDDVSGNEKHVLLTVMAPASSTGPSFIHLSNRPIGAPTVLPGLCRALRIMRIRGPSLPFRSTNQGEGQTCNSEVNHMLTVLAAKRGFTQERALH